MTQVLLGLPDGPDTDDEPLLGPSTSSDGYSTRVDVGKFLDDVNLYNEDLLDLSWTNIQVTAESETKKCFCWRRNQEPSTKKILNNVSGTALPGQLLAIMGPSGAGKTTLLNILTGRSVDLLNWTGSIKVNGSEVAGSQLTRLSAYVQQHDLFIGTLTVREHLTFQAILRMDKRHSYTSRMYRVDEVLDEFGLTKCAHTRIGKPGKTKGISGGEMKRLAFASEVLTNPKLMFCDEPTSGLDSVMAFNVVTVLNNMAANGKTIICTIHQPSSETYNLFHRILFMARGKLIYTGTPVDAKDFFKRQGINFPTNTNQAEVIMEQLSIQPNNEVHGVDIVENLIKAFEQEGITERFNQVVNEAHANGDVPILRLDDNSNSTQCSYRAGSKYKAGWWKQLAVLLQRSFITVRREKILITVRFGQTLFLSFLLAAIYWRQVLDQDGVMNINGAFFIMLTNITFHNVLAVMNVFSAEIPIFLREHWNGMYRTDTYFISKTLADLPVFIVLPMIYVCILYPAIGFRGDWGAFLICLGLFVLVCNVACSFGYMFSCITSSIEKALSLSSPLLTLVMLFGGFFLNTLSVPVYFVWLKWLSWFHYGNEALLVNQWEKIDYIACSNNHTGCFDDGKAVLHYYGFKGENFYFDVLMLVVLFAGFRIVAFFGLLLKSRKKM